MWEVTSLGALSCRTDTIDSVILQKPNDVIAITQSVNLYTAFQSKVQKAVYRGKKHTKTNGS